MRLFQRLKVRSDAGFFHRVAKRGWERSGHFTFTGESSALRAWLTARLPAQQKVLTLGCGTGELERVLRRAGHHVVGVDVVREMLKVAQRRGIKRVVQADAHFLPFRAAAFDVVILPETLGYIEVQRVFREVARVLKARGRFLITSYPVHFFAHVTYRKLSTARIVRGLARGGFSVREQRFLVVKPRSVREVDVERESVLLYLLAKKNVRQRLS
ncbi:MAG: class I SAM-dependent methyltransferase [Deltaproteobacteria bacterium]|nr:class I SAM-dependent methyltransferase [Deltaproteobacteria bacterium]